MSGADAVQMVSAILSNGTGHIKTVLDNLVAWMEEKEYLSIEQII